MVRPKQVNLINEDVLKKAFPRKVKSKGGNPRVAIIILAVVVIFLTTEQAAKVAESSLRVANAKRELQETKKKLNGLRSQVLELEKKKNELAKEEALRKQRLEFLLSTSSQETNYANLLALITSYIPQDLWIDHFRVNKTDVEISGTAVNPQLITQFINQLNSSGIFSNSHFSSTEKQKIESQEVQNFNLTTEPNWEVISKSK